MDKKVEVEMLAFGKPGEIRTVVIPDHDLADAIQLMLDKVFHWGQNDFQPQECPSISVGDVIRLSGEHWLVAPVGFKKLTDDEYSRLVQAERRERSFLAYDMTEEA